MLKTGQQAPDFELPDNNGDPVKLSSFRGKKNVVLFFYPKDFTGGCTAEACSFRDSYEDFTDAGAEVIGISSDDVISHRKFARQYKLPFILLSDKGGKVKELFGVKDDLFGLIAGRVTFVINKEGVVIKVFDSQVNFTGHSSEALAALISA
ncbi:MAG: putative peroxiredoxin bcp [Bacteroidia bacterium]|nr:putative peroxiredoxin bcp [Bacteroidia bacterium]